MAHNADRLPLRGAGRTAAVPRKRCGTRRPGRDRPLYHLGDTGAVPLFRGVAAAGVAGGGGGAGTGRGAAVPPAVRHRRRRGIRLSFRAHRRLSRGRQDHGKPCAARASPAGGRGTAADVLQQRGAGVHSGHRGQRRVPKPPRRGVAVPHSRGGGHGGGGDFLFHSEIKPEAKNCRFSSGFRPGLQFPGGARRAAAPPPLPPRSSARFGAV